MRSITQNIILDRLQQALASRGVDLKRSAILEVAAQTFGFLDGNAFVAAMKEGRFDPPNAQMLGTTWHDGTRLTVLRDPLSSSVYAVDAQALPSTTRDVRFGISPYGNLLTMPEDQETQSQKQTTAGMTVTTGSVETRTLADGRTAVTVAMEPASTTPEKGKVVYVVDTAGNATDPEVAEWRHLLTTDDDIEVDCGPVRWADAWRMARIDGRLYFAITAGEEYEDHEQGVLALRSFQAYVQERGEAIRRLGGLVHCEDDLFFSRIELEVMLPVELAEHVDDIHDWHQAIAILMGADHEAVTATFGPQVWVGDDAHATDPEGDVEFDVTVEILLMGAKSARAIEDFRDSSDELQMAALAPDWIRDWKGPFYVTVADEIPDYLDLRAQDKDEPWSCDNCGETAQDGSGICVTCGVDSNEDDDVDDTPEDAVCDHCEQLIDYETGICTGCGHDHSETEVVTPSGQTIAGRKADEVDTEHHHGHSAIRKDAADLAG